MVSARASSPFASDHLLDAFRQCGGRPEFRCRCACRCGLLLLRHRRLVTAKAPARGACRGLSAASCAWEGKRAAACGMKAPNAADVRSPIEPRSSKRPMVLKVVAAAATLTLSQFDQCAVAILADIVFGWRLLRERRLNAQGESSTGGDTFATVVAISTSMKRHE